MDPFIVHVAPERHAYFADVAASPPFFDPTLRCWAVAQPALIEAILKVPQLFPPPNVGDYEVLSERTGVSFDNIVFAFQHIPLSFTDEAHRVTRRNIATQIAERREACATALPEILATRLAPLTRPGEVDLVGDIVGPLVRDVIGVLTGVAITDPEACQRASLIFDRLSGLRKRREIDEKVGRIRAMIRASIGPDASETDEGVRLALFSLGGDAMLGTLTESFYWLLRDRPGTRLADLPLGDMPPETGVPYVERIAREPVTVAGLKLQPGDRVRMMMQGAAYSGDPAERGRIFGVGAHSCLGRQLSLDVWGLLRAWLSKASLRATVIDYRPRITDFVFTCPDRLVIRLEN